MKLINRILSPFIAWRLRHVSHRNFILLLSVAIGVVVGIFAVGVKLLVYEVNALVTSLKVDTSFVLLFFLPFIGILITNFLAKNIFKETLGHGVTNVLLNISKGSSLIRKRLFLSRIMTSIVSVSFGGSVGLEAPLIISGSAFGSNLGRLMHLHYKSRTLLIGCGSAAAIAGIFNSPIAAVIFVLEVILSEINIDKFIPILISSICASLASTFLLHDEALFNFVIQDELIISDLPFYIALGVVCGLVALYFTRIHYWVEGKLKSIESNSQRMIIGGLALSIIIFVFPSMYGEGYETIKALLNGNHQAIASHELLFSDMHISGSILVIVTLLILLKAIASASTIGAGGSGGIFAPSLFTGGLVGYLLTQVSLWAGFTRTLSVSNFTLLGMCGVLTGVLHAPLTGVFLIAEITGGYTLFVPLMLVSTLAYITIRIFEPHSIYTKHLIEKGDLIVGNKDKEILSLIEKKKLIEKNDPVFLLSDTLDKAIEVIQSSERLTFAVVDDKCHLKGVINWEDIKSIVFSQHRDQNMTVKTVMHNAKILIFESDSSSEIMAKFEKSGKWCLPTLKSDGTFAGFIYKETLFKNYRERLIKQYESEL